MMTPQAFDWSIEMLRRRAGDDPKHTLWDLIRDAEALREGKPTAMPRNEVVDAVEREMVK